MVERVPAVHVAGRQVVPQGQAGVVEQGAENTGHRPSSRGLMRASVRPSVELVVPLPDDQEHTSWQEPGIRQCSARGPRERLGHPQPGGLGHREPSDSMPKLVNVVHLGGRDRPRDEPFPPRLDKWRTTANSLSGLSGARPENCKLQRPPTRPGPLPDRGHPGSHQWHRSANPAAQPSSSVARRIDEGLMSYPINRRKANARGPTHPSRRDRGRFRPLSDIAAPLEELVFERKQISAWWAQRLSQIDAEKVVVHRLLLGVKAAQAVLKRLVFVVARPLVPGCAIFTDV